MNPTTLTVRPSGSSHAMTLDLTAIYAAFEQVPDQRHPRGIRYPLAVMLTIALWAKLSGATHVRAIADWARDRQTELAAQFDLARARMPHPTTWSRVLGAAVASTALEQALTTVLAPASAEVPARASMHVALDGKTLRGTIPAGHTQGVHLLSAYAVASGVVLAHEAVSHKENEIVAAPRVLDRLTLTGMLLTGDAMFAQRALSVQIVEAGGDYCWMLKENQPTLLDDLRILFSPALRPVAKGWSPMPLDFVVVERHEKSHGRQEYRRLTVSSLLADYSDWPYLRQAFQIVRITRQGRMISRDERYGITSAPATVLPAAQLAATVRAHWQIENGLHYRRDVSLHEDASHVRMGQAPQILACLNNAVCSLAKRAGQANLPAMQRALATATDRLLFRT